MFEDERITQGFLIHMAAVTIHFLESTLIKLKDTSLLGEVDQYKLRLRQGLIKGRYVKTGY